MSITKIAGVGTFLFIALGAAPSCTPGAFLTPPTGPGTPYPCGYYGVSCMPFDGTHTCCGEGDMCIRDGCDHVGLDHTLGASAPSPRLPEK